MQFDDEADAPRLKVVERGRNTVIRIVADAGDGDLRQPTLCDRIRGVPRLDACSQAAQPGNRGNARRQQAIDGNSLIEFQVWLRKSTIADRSGVMVVPEMTASQVPFSK